MTNANWQPTANFNTLRIRANILTKIRNFFSARDVLEVETPLLCTSTTTDPYIHSFITEYRSNQKLFLQTSPEFPMKRLLAAGSGPIYQICKAFRSDELGRKHNPEFTLLEWYRPDFDHFDLMQEVDDLLQELLGTHPGQRISYTELFQQHLAIDPHSSTITALKQCAKENDIVLSSDINIQDKDVWLDLLLTHCIEPHLGQTVPTFIYDYPASQAAFAKKHPDNANIAERFEVYYQGMELGNGYHELLDANEQKQRFQMHNNKRKTLGHDEMPLDAKLLAAMTKGLPPCAGIAIGVDRLVLLATKSQTIEEVISFSFARV